MAYIKKLKDNELVGGTNNSDVYPVSTTQAIYSQDSEGNVREKDGHPQVLEDRLTDIENYVGTIASKTEKFVVYLDNPQDEQTFEIGVSSNFTITGYANMEYFGDEPVMHIPTAEMTTKTFRVTNPDSTRLVYTGSTTEYTRTASVYTELFYQVGTYTFSFECAFNGLTKTATSNIYMRLRGFFGFAESDPYQDLDSLGTSCICNGSPCEVLIPADPTGEQFKHIYFAVPSYMPINRVVQVDALNAPLAITVMHPFQRTIGGRNYDYKILQSTDLIDSNYSKRLRIE